jgi:HD superfamily phosphodiesterase
MSMISKMLSYVLIASKKFNIDDSHGLSHSMDVLQHAHNIYTSETSKFVKPLYIHNSTERIIYSSAILHDMCDKKYMNPTVGIQHIEEFLQDKFCHDEIHVIKRIIETMSYTTVKKYGFPELGEYNQAYHIVREADLLSAYNFDRSMIYYMNRNNNNADKAFRNAEELFRTRVFMHNVDNLFIHDYSIKMSTYLHQKSMIRMKVWKKLIK